MDNRERKALKGLVVEWRHQGAAFDDKSALLCARQLERVLGEARAAIEGGAACPECTLGPPNWSERKPGYCSYCNDTGLRPKVRVLEAAPRDVSTLSKESLRYLVPVEVQAAAPLPTARDILSELSAFLLNMRRDARDSKDVVLENYVEGIEQFVTRLMAAPQPISGLQRTAGDVLRQFRESGSEDWGELESAINWWAMNEFCPNFTKGDRAVSEGRLRELVAKWRKGPWHTYTEGIPEAYKEGVLDCADELERSLESA